MTLTAPLIEIYSTIQGEGPYVGQQMLFVRFLQCDLACAFCDTPSTFQKLEKYRVEYSPHSGDFTYFENPSTVAQLMSHLERFQNQTLSLTGGEPLLHHKFIQALLTQLAGRYRVLLESSGIHADRLATIIDQVDIVSMDFKLPSAAQTGTFWQEHLKFLQVAQKKEVYVKAIVTNDTQAEDILMATQLLKNLEKPIELILQPVSPGGRIKTPISLEHLLHLQKVATENYAHVRVIPQIHKILGVL
ncbi:MAG: 7-carboxy-7-deazaguanine synthase QueE [Deltaproteobacteria bacterium]|nr:7-carboxy-7-deazaguanine synthase QueE [Deltaproteobacteria bacterium]